MVKYLTLLLICVAIATAANAQSADAQNNTKRFPRPDGERRPPPFDHHPSFNFTNFDNEEFLFALENNEEWNVEEFFHRPHHKPPRGHPHGGFGGHRPHNGTERPGRQLQQDATPHHRPPVRHSRHPRNHHNRGSHRIHPNEEGWFHNEEFWLH